MPLLSLEDVTFGYHKRQTDIESISVDVGAGEVLGLLGPNGAGKTTLVSLIIGQHRPRSGRIHLEGRPVYLGHPDIALVPQEYAFYPKLTGRENLSFFAGLLPVPASEQKQRVAQALEATELSDHADKAAGRYSGGLKRRLNFAIALLQKPRLLLLDEPTANVDPHSRRFLLDNIRALNARGTAIIYTSHLLSEVESIARQVAVMNRGRIVLYGELNELLREDHSHLAVRLKSPMPPPLRTQLAAHADEDHWYHCDLSACGLTPAETLQLLENAGLAVESLRYGQRRLEDVYLKCLADQQGAP